MAQLKILCEKFAEPAEGKAPESRVYTYDTLANKLWLSEEEYVGLVASGNGKTIGTIKSTFEDSASVKLQAPWGPEAPPSKSREVRRVKIQMGLTCNFECSYCSQRFVERPVQGNPGKVDHIVEKIKSIFTIPKGGADVCFEFWGGEPFVYWKTFKPMAEKLRTLYPHARLQVISNGSLLTRDIVDWLFAMRFSVAISHDGPGQSIRGPCPIDDGSAETKDAIKYLIEKLAPLNLLSFNSMLNAQNISRLKIRQWFEDRFGPNLPPIGEGGLIDAYDDDGAALSLTLKKDHFEFRNTALRDILSSDSIKFQIVETKIKNIVSSIVENKEVTPQSTGQKCGMERKDYISFDMDGNIITCQNVSAVQKAPNGSSHHIGSLENLEDTKLISATHWADRPHCYKCPVLSLCSGSCMFLQGDNWFTSCDNAYSDNIVFLALGILKLTGYLPVFIEGEGLPDHRKDIWGTILEHQEVKVKKAFPIKVVTK